MTDVLAPIIDDLAELQWKRMTRTSTPYADLTPSDRAACRAIVAPVLADLQRLGLVITNADSNGRVVTTITLDTSGRHGEPRDRFVAVLRHCPACKERP